MFRKTYSGMIAPGGPAACTSAGVEAGEEEVGGEAAAISS